MTTIIEVTKFIKIHRSYVINTDYIDSINSDTVIIGDTTLPLSKAFRDDLLSRIKIG